MESGKISKVDLKKFLNCKVLLDGNIQCTTFKGTNGSGLTVAQKHGYFTSDNVTVKETALNNTVLRIHLIKEDLLELKRNYRTCLNNSRSRKKINELKISSFGRQIKRKSNFFDENFVHTPLRRNIDTTRTIESAKRLVSNSGKSEKQMRSQNEKDYKNTSETNKYQLRHEMMKNVSDNSPKTQNKAIKRSYRDKIKIRLFPKSSTPIRTRNGAVNLRSHNSMKLQKEVLLVKNSKREHQWNNSNKTYFLKFSPYHYPEDGTLGYSFQKLVTDVKHMKLPAPSWKIKVIIRQGKIAAITFTNKLTLERCIGFTANSNKYKITIDNKPALLLGSPEHVRTSEDLEILLDIIQNIDSENPMVFYK